MPYRFGEFQLDPIACEITRQDDSVDIQPRVFDLIRYLIEHRERIVSKEELLKEVWHGAVVSESALVSALRDARRALGDSGSAQRILSTVPKRGYRFVAALADPIETSGKTKSQSERQTFGQGYVPERMASAMPTRTRPGKILILEGEPGSGKTHALVTAGQIAQQQAVHAAFRWFPRKADAPNLWPWLQILRQLFLHSESLNDATCAESARELSSLFADLPATANLSPRANLESSVLFRICEATEIYLRALSQNLPLVILLDDLQHADETSLRLLEHLGRVASGAPISIFVTIGPFDSARDTRLTTTLNELTNACCAERVVLGALDRAAVYEWLTVAIAADVSPTWVGPIHEWTGGNPLFLQQLISGISVDAFLKSATGDSEPPITTGIRDATRGRLLRLSAAVHNILAAAAEIGAEFDVEELAALSGIPSTILQRALGEAEFAYIVARMVSKAGSQTRWRFLNPLIHSAVKREIAPDIELATDAKPSRPLTPGITNVF